MRNYSGILAALQQQLECYQRLAKLAQSQREYVEQGNTESLLSVLEQRHAVMLELAPLEKIVAPIKREWAAFVATLPVPVRATAEAIVLSARTLLEQITRSDQDDVMLLQQRKIDLGRQLTRTNSTRQVNKAYAASAYRRPIAKMDVAK